jgi:hypothetical protein
VRTDQFINLAITLKPLRIATLGVLGNLADELNGLGFITRFAGVVGRDHHLDLDRHDVTTASHKPDRLDSLPRNSHRSPVVEEMDCHELRLCLRSNCLPDKLTKNRDEKLTGLT